MLGKRHFDSRKEHLLSRYTWHQQEVCSLEWSVDGSTLASGGNDNAVYLTEGPTAAGPRKALLEHRAAVKGLAWCPWNANLLATGAGSADRTIRFWNAQSGACLNSIDTGSQVTDLKWSLQDKESSGARSSLRDRSLSSSF